MGCVSSKLVKKDLREADITITHRCLNHVVSLTSSTYGLLNLDNPQQPIVVAEINSKNQEDPEIINAWELMEGLEDAIPIKKNSPKSRSVLRGFADFDARSPLKLLNQFGSPMKAKKSVGKENKANNNRFGYSPKGLVLMKSTNNGTENSCKKSLNMGPAVKPSPISAKRRSFGSDSSRRKSFSPLFDPEMVASYEKEMSEEEEQIKRVVLPSPKTRKMRYANANSRDCESMLKLFEKKCPPGGENAVIVYTTTLRGIRKTFEDCNNVRSIVESHLVRVIERDISMDAGFKEEIRGIMGTKEVRVPLVFVKGRLIGGAEEIVKLEEEGKLEVLFDGIPKANGGCQGCAGMRFVMCGDCNGSCKVLDEEMKKMVKCGVCNENGLIHCPICC